MFHVCFLQTGDQGDVPYHPRETTNMRTQTVASYFRVRKAPCYFAWIICHIAKMSCRWFPSSRPLCSTPWWTCCPRWWRGSPTLCAASNPTTIARPTSSTARRFWCSCGTPGFWRPPRSGGRATPTASCSPTSWRGQQLLTNTPGPIQRKENCWLKLC